MKVLITGFDPFGGEKINPAWEAVKGIKNIIKKKMASRGSTQLIQEIYSLEV